MLIVMNNAQGNALIVNNTLNWQILKMKYEYRKQIKRRINGAKPIYSIYEIILIRRYPL